MSASSGAPSPQLPHGNGRERLTIGDVVLIDVVAPGAPTAIVFSAVNARSFSYYKLFNGLPVNRVFVRDPANLWYQKGVSPELPSFEALAAYLAEVVRRLRPSKTVTFGSSMGGYASLLFGDRLNADAVVSICPQTLLDPRLPHTPAEAPAGVNADLAAALAAPSSAARYVFFGSIDVVDIYNVFRLDHEAMTLLPIADQDHMVMHHLMKNGEFERCMAAILADEPYVCTTPLDERCRDPLLRGLVARLVDGFYRQADWSPERYARALVALEPDWPAANYMLARVWAEQDRLEDAAKQAGRAAKRAPDSIDFAEFRANLFLRRNMFDEALSAFERCLVIRPKHYAALCALASLHARAGRTAEALRLLDEAVEVRPRLTRAPKLRERILAGRLDPPQAEPVRGDD